MPVRSVRKHPRGPARQSQGRHVGSRQRGRWRAVAAGLIVVALGLVAAALVYARPAATAGGIVTFSNLSRDHVNGPITYPQVPPVGGPHNPVWLNCGIYDQPVPNQNAVHSLEHGAVWITYQPDLPAADVARLRSLVRNHAYVILSPYPGLPTRVVASAWGVQLQATGADDPRLPQFIKTYEQGPQTPEPGAPCSGGRGVPIFG
ncbi:MAG TPA: DUF3105 domain-containing protein [Roseiflexaceae bacterium]|jgi:hypothetical protein